MNCRCGSDQPRRELNDARGIFCAYVCDRCEADRRGYFRRDVFSDPNYPADESIEED
jgi:hypothetical protein